MDGCEPMDGWYDLQLADARSNSFVGDALIAALPTGVYAGVELDDFDDPALYYTTGAPELDVCRETSWGSFIIWEPPRLSTGISTGGEGHWVGPIELVAHYAPDCSTVAARLTARFDARTSGDGLPLVLGTGDADAACAMVEGTATPCVPCDDGEPYCIDVVIEDIGGPCLDQPMYAGWNRFNEVYDVCGDTALPTCGCTTTEHTGPWQAAVLGLFGLLAWRRRNT